MKWLLVLSAEEKQSEKAHTCVYEPYNTKPWLTFQDETLYPEKWNIEISGPPVHGVLLVKHDHGKCDSGLKAPLGKEEDMLYQNHYQQKQQKS